MTAVLALGDIVGASFDGEAEVVLFNPQSGDILICATSDWAALVAEKFQHLAINTGVHLAAGGQDSVLSTDNLRSTLIHLGAKID